MEKLYAWAIFPGFPVLGNVIIREKGTQDVVDCAFWKTNDILHLQKAKTLRLFH